MTTGRSSSRRSTNRAEFWLYAVRNPERTDALLGQLRKPRAGMERLMGDALERIGERDNVSAEDVTTIALALFQGLLRQRRLDPAGVPEKLFGQAMRWLSAGIAASGSNSGGR
ncbi:hypothetical protein ACFFNX_00610 [Actinoallomurus acaciae]|uniref:BetI-type transcriptional repressor C-terminal domain-containing protein n=1 Tax=Actinoallomurus acaciae TaxID=502577 RepID=A0ABV5Y7P8_9ACTN